MTRQQIIDCHDAIGVYCMANRRSMFKSQKSPCIFHRKKCPVLPPPFQQTVDGRRIHEAPLCGTDCTPWSAQGGQAGWAHPAIPRFWVCLSKCMCGAFSCFGLENSRHGFPQERVRKIIEEHGFATFGVAVDACDGGWPGIRDRYLIWCVDRSEWILTASPNPKEQQAEFNTVFAKKLAMTVDDFAALDCDANLFAELRDKAKNRGINTANREALSLLTLKDLCCPGAMRERFDIYDQKRED